MVVNSNDDVISAELAVSHWRFLSMLLHNFLPTTDADSAADMASASVSDWMIFTLCHTDLM